MVYGGFVLWLVFSNVEVSPLLLEGLQTFQCAANLSYSCCTVYRQDKGVHEFFIVIITFTAFPSKSQ